MPRKARIVMKGDSAVYHVISRTALEGFVLGDAEKDFFLNHIKKLSSVYFAEILSFCIMGNHFHIVVRMHQGNEYSDEELQKRFEIYYEQDNKRVLMNHQVPFYRNKWSDLSWFIKEIKQGFSRYYNKRHKRRGYFWSDRFKSVLVEDGETLINCLAYVDLNPVRANICQRPENYRWSSLGYQIQTGNGGDFISLDFGLTGNENISKEERLAEYRQFVYEKGGLESTKGKKIDTDILESEKEKGFNISTLEKFQQRTRYFTDSGIIGTKEFVYRVWKQFQDGAGVTEKKPISIKGLKGVYSLKRLNENIF